MYIEHILQYHDQTELQSRNAALQTGSSGRDRAGPPDPRNRSFSQTTNAAELAARGDVSRDKSTHYDDKDTTRRWLTDEFRPPFDPSSAPFSSPPSSPFHPGGPTDGWTDRHTGGLHSVVGGMGAAEKHVGKRGTQF
ncbi:hypothetical protein AAFF_G00223960 [Aldrovandia affinis]|uniref:Uncharacterized protein n=1 Tax=Aldrovandia affinis TaxID=143900 RepID=A0AAD7X2A6_9TELE|nr:hypothetical protein AAFF_G00223960 [Aldrovandia affinis]